MLAVKFQEVSVKASIFSLIQQNVIDFNIVNLCTHFYISHIFDIIQLFWVFSLKNIYLSLFTLFFSLILSSFYLIHHYIDSYNSFSFLSRCALRYFFSVFFLCFFVSFIVPFFYFLWIFYIVSITNTLPTVALF